MDPGSPQGPDLVSILQTLAAYAPRQPAVVGGASELEEGEYDPTEFNPIQPAPAPFIQNDTAEKPITPSKTAKPIQSTTHTAPPPSPSSITTWPKALNHTIKYIFPNPDKKRQIQHLIQTQHKHEREWWAAREELIRKAQGRDKSRLELDSVLASVGGLVATSSHLRGESEGDEVKKELAVFDRKVHSACRQMIDASNKEIRELGVPFFCAGISDKIEREELNSLKKKMLQFLEDSCGSENPED